MDKLKSLVKWVRLRPKIEKYCYLGIIITVSYALIDEISYRGIIYNNYLQKSVRIPSTNILNPGGHSHFESEYIGKAIDEFSLSVWLIISLLATILILGGKNK